MISELVDDEHTIVKKNPKLRGFMIIGHIAFYAEVALLK